MGYREELQFVINSNKDIFPDFLFTPLFNDFGEECYQNGLSEDPRVKEAQKIRHKYKNYFDYINATMAYNDYMNHLVEKYGSLSIIKNSRKVGMFDDFVPPKPKLKKNRTNKEFLRSKIIPSRKIELEFDGDTIRQIANELYPLDRSAIQTIDEINRFQKPDKKTRKLNQKAIQQIAGLDRRNNLYRSSSTNNGVDFIIEYMNQTSKGFYDEKGERKEYSISEILKEERRKYGIPEELLIDEMNPNTSVVIHNRLVSRTEQQRIDILTELYKIGINLLDSSKLMDKNSVKMIKKQAGDYDELDDPSLMNKKELKRFKKRKKKEQEALLKRQDNDRILTKSLLSNRFNFESKGNNISFKLRDLYKDE